MAAPRSLVTGACGFMGTRLVEMLVAAGHQVRATDLAEAYEADDRGRGRFPSVLRAHDVEFIAEDLARPQRLAELVDGVDYVFHVASIFSYSASRQALTAVNVEGTRALCEALVDHPRLRKLLLWGAGGIYGFVPDDELPIREDETPPSPANEYLRSKWRQEWLVARYHRRHGLPYCVLRPTTVYGPRQVYAGGQMILQAARMKVLAAPVNWTGRVPFVHVDDVCGAALYLATQTDLVGEAYNLDDDSGMSLIDFMRLMAELTEGRFVLLPPVPLGPLRALATEAARLLQGAAALLRIATPLEADTIDYLGRNFWYSNDKLKSAGYVFAYPDAREGIRQTYQWYVDNGWLA